MNEGLALITGLIVAFVTTFLVIPGIIKKAKERNFVGRDVHKTKRVFVAELGGIPIVLGFCVGVFSAIAVLGLNDGHLDLVSLFAAISSILLVFVVGIMDDLFWIKWRTKIFLPLIASVPLIAVKVGNPVMNIPYLGPVNLGWFYLLVLIPLAVTGATNAMNMIGGYNGSEAGLGLLMMLTLLIIAVDSGHWVAGILLIAMIGALLAFLYFNWYPAKIFMGDSGTLQMGAVIASAVIIGNMEKYGLFLFFWYFVNLAIFAWGLARGAKLVKFASPGKDGKLIAPKTFWKHYLPFTIIHFTHPTEKQLVCYLLLMQLAVSVGVLALYFTGF